MQLYGCQLTKNKIIIHIKPIGLIPPADLFMLPEN